MKHSMLQSFYNYIVNELLIGYFKKYPMQKGNRYFMIVENEKHREMLIQALNDACDKITISGIYQSNVLRGGNNNHSVHFHAL